jgi:hypothetical protein
MSIASEITRLQGVKSNILDAIAAKGVSVPSGAKLADCPELISLISGGGGFEADNVVNIVPINKMVVVDANGYIGFDLTNYFQTSGATFYNYAILSAGDDFSSKGLGRVTIYTPTSDVIGGRLYRTVVIGGREWLAENLDFKWDGLVIGGDASYNEPRANYYNNDEATYGVNGNRYGLLYNSPAVNYLDDNNQEIEGSEEVDTTREVSKLLPLTYSMAAGASTKAPIHIYGANFMESIDMSDLATGIDALDITGTYSDVLGAPLRELNVGTPITGSDHTFTTILSPSTCGVSPVSEGKNAF